MVYRVAVEIWPARLVLPAGYRPAPQISGHDFEREPPDDPNESWVSRGSGPCLHTHPQDRPASTGPALDVLRQAATYYSDR